MKNNALKSNSALLLAAIIWGLAFVTQREGMDHIGPLAFTVIRSFLAAVALLIGYLIFNRKRIRNPKKDELKRDIVHSVKSGLICGIFLCFATICQQVGLKYTTAGKAGFITALYIVLVPIASALIFRKKPGLTVCSGVSLALVGLYLLSFSGDDGFSIGKGDLWIIFSALLYTVQIMCVDRFASDCDSILFTAAEFFVVTILTAVLMFIFEGMPTVSAVADAKLSLLYTGILSGGLGYGMQTIGQKHSDNPTVASLLMSLEAVFAAIFGWIILHETLNQREIIGIVLMSAAMVLAQIKSGSDKKRNIQNQEAAGEKLPAEVK